MPRRKHLIGAVAIAAAFSIGCGDNEAADAPPADERGNRTATDKLDLTPSLPPETITYKDPTEGVEITFPADWHRARESLTPRMAEPREIVAVGNIPLRPGPGEGCSRSPDSPQVDIGEEDALVSVAIQPSHGTGTGYRQPRPFRLLEQVEPVDSSDPRGGQVLPWTCLDRVGIAGTWKFFAVSRDRVAYVTAVAGEETSDETRSEVLGVLESLKFY